MFSGLDTLLQAAQFLEQQEQQQPPQPQRLNSDVSIIPTNGSISSNRSVNTNSGSSTISFIPSNSTSVSASRFQPPIGKISNGTVILTASGSQNGSSTRILASPINGSGTTTTALVTGLVPQGTTAYLTTTTTATNGSKIGQHLPSAQRLHPTGTATIVPVISGGSRKRTISNASNHSSGGYVKDEPILNGHSSSTAPPLVVISTSSSGSNGQQLLHHHHNNSSSISTQQKQHLPPALTIDLSTKSSSSSHHLSHHAARLSSGTPPSASSGCSSSSTSSTLTISPVDDSQSSLNLSGSSTTSGYITSLSANSSSSLNLSGSPPGSGGCLSSSSSTSSASSNSSPLPHDLVIVQQQQQHQMLLSSSSQQSPPPGGLSSGLLVHVPTGGRRRTVSSNSNGVGTREVHNKLEKNRRAHLKECFEQLKKQLTLQPDEKKTSNLSILHAAIRHIQVLKRKEREYEHEMERLAKEKISSQNRILVLKRELSQWGDVDFSRLAPDTDAIPTASNGSATPSERDLLNDPPGIAPGRNGIRYSSSSSLSSVATTASSIGNLPLQTTISPVLVAASSSPSRASPPSATMARSSNSPAAMPLSLTTKSVPEQSPLKLNGLNLSNGTSSSGPTTTATLPLMVGSQSQLFTPVTTILTTGNGSAIQTLPLNLNVTSNGHHHQNGLITSTASGLQIIGTSSTNGATAFPLPTSAVVTNGKELINGTTANGTTKNGLRTTTVSDAGGNKIEIIATQTTAGSGLEPPATKVIKLVNGNTLVGLTSMDKDKMMLSQVVQQGGIVVSPIQLLTSTQGLRVIQQAPNGLATIELSSPTNVQSQPSQVHRTTGGNNGITSSAIVPHNHNHQHLPSQTHQHHHQQPHQQIQQVTGAQLHKLLLSSAAVTNGTPTTTTTINGGTTPELARLPGGAELNILPAGSNGSTTTATLPLYRTTTVGGPQTQAGKLTFVNAIANGNGLTLKGTDVSGASRGAVHVVQSGQLSSLTPVVVSRYDHHLHHQDAVTTSLFTTAPASGKMGTLVSRN
ncbi:mucin-5AC isoform X2 [Culex quinquefasciatus]|uniref:mucin-5AC isoform X2 n=1 Tax=Culex quinquefasciatus TaxID=7176 RepID=UPI0018E3ED22|nr:mucin-5AC isoform X2 [Culex quinquefasciatus]XP_038120296.1 mucin-5AC isoform X2 [Culex quinquefasciatus]XP_038120297.1 mucin-5AC isoform X2 [Culex quinquefasciatus]XP_038120298.1 mucin-5AC isoform X2 [Culex quinquefasciatus]XP_038120299.1 mucin-5AC isoform X2 [Culex quinquefasciatus]XP_038120300.1 mucin-5AC isoform X2 [Culex quinquefasciatus]